MQPGSPNSLDTQFCHRKCASKRKKRGDIWSSWRRVSYLRGSDPRLGGSGSVNCELNAAREDPARTDTTSYNKKQLVMGHCRMMRSVAGINRPRKRPSHETRNSCTHSRRRDADLGGMRHVGRRGYRRWHRFHARTHRAGRRDRRWIGYAVRHLPLGKPLSRKQRRGLSAWVRLGSGPT